MQYITDMTVIWKQSALCCSVDHSNTSRMFSLPSQAKRNYNFLFKISEDKIENLNQDIFKVTRPCVTF